MNNIRQTPNRVRVWAGAIRPATLLVGVVPVLVGTVTAALAGYTDALLSVAALVGALGLQVGCNLVNDAADFATGADGDDRLGPPRAAQQGWLTARALWVGAGLAFAVSTLASVALIRAGGWPIVGIGVAGVLAAVGYTAGPIRLGYLGLGDLLVFAFFGVAAVTGTDYVLRGSWSFTALLASVPVGALATAVLVVNNLRDRHTDARVGKRTLAVRWGGRAARWEYATLVAVAYVSLGVGAVLGWGLAWWLPWLTVPLAVRLVRAVFREDGARLNPLLGGTARLMTAFGLLFTAGVVQRFVNWEGAPWS